MLKFAAPHKISLIEDLEIHHKIEKAIYGGLLFYNDRYIQCDPTHRDNLSYDLCLDHNGIYANCMSNYEMPIGDYKILEPQNYPDFSTIEENGGYGYFMTVSGEIPQEFHDYYQMMPHFISTQKIGFENMFPYNRKRIKEHKIP